MQDVFGRGGPDEGPGVVIMAVDVVANRDDELFQIPENAAADTVLGQVAEETLDHVQPRCRGWREVHMEVFVP